MAIDKVTTWYVTIMWALTAIVLIFVVLYGPASRVLRTQWTPLAVFDIAVGIMSLVFLIIWSIQLRRENKRYAASRELKAEAAINAYQSVIRYVQGERYDSNGDRYKEE